MTFAQVDSLQNNPCSEDNKGLVVHFIKETNTIHETPCDSLDHIAQYLESDTITTWAIIGIAKDTSQIEIKKAKERGDIVKDRLIELGANEDMIITYHSVHKEPKDGEHRDWPYYPKHFDYEIGVFINPEIE